MPICASIAGFVVWVANRDYLLSDSGLIRHFLFVMTICIVIIFGVSKTNTAQMYFDPQFRLQAELDAHPVYSTIKRISPDDLKALHDFLVLRMSHGETLSYAFLQARPLLTMLTRRQLGFADQKSLLTWGRVAVDTLKVLQAIDPMLCYRAISHQALDSQTLLHAFNADNTKIFQQAIIDVYEFSHRISNPDGSPRHEAIPQDNTPVDFNTAGLEYRAIKETVTQRFGESISGQLAMRLFLELPIEPPEQICAAKIFQLESMLERPQAMASTLLYDNSGIY